jgi:hypothetical protein
MQQLTLQAQFSVPCDAVLSIAAYPRECVVAFSELKGWNMRSVSVWKWSARGFVRMWKKTGFEDNRHDFSVYVAFLLHRAVLLVSDGAANTVRALSGLTGAHHGLIAPLGSIYCPREVATSAAHVAVLQGEGTVYLYQQCGDLAWQFLRRLDCFRDCKMSGLRLSVNGCMLTGCYVSTRRIVFVDAVSGHVRREHSMSHPIEKEEVLAGRWVVLGPQRLVWISECWTVVISRPTIYCRLVHVPGFGMIKGDALCGVDVYSSPDLLAMTAMSPLRMAWVAANAA